MTPAFILVDLLEDFFTDPTLALHRESIVRGANELVGLAREIGALVVWVRQEFAPDLSDAFLSMRRTGRRVTIAGTRGCRLLPELEVRPGDHEIVKKRYSAFFGTGLDRLLETQRCTHTVIGGINSHACVRATSIDAYQRDYEVILASEAIASYDEGFHRESMRYLGQSIGEIMSNREIRSRLGR